LGSEIGLAAFELSGGIYERIVRRAHAVGFPLVNQYAVTVETTRTAANIKPFFADI